MSQTKRAPSALRALKQLGRSGIPARAVFPDGTVIEVLAGTLPAAPDVTEADKEANEADQAFDVAFNQGIQKPK
ncbi:hypothetical protein [Asticcacaulis solisilvae]|uniref:hypothetical protein n=1 Tax=Asticcacaulis solisilvae TaxID=1217274 RepID=UPI003FD71E5B